MRHWTWSGLSSIVTYTLLVPSFYNTFLLQILFLFCLKKGYCLHIKGVTFLINLFSQILIFSLNLIVPNQMNFNSHSFSTWRCDHHSSCHVFNGFLIFMMILRIILHIIVLFYPLFSYPFSLLLIQKYDLGGVIGLLLN